MKLIIHRDDLLPENEKMNCSQTKFEHFKKDVQAAIIACGKGTFTEWDGSNYNVILAPREDKICPICGEPYSESRPTNWGGMAYVHAGDPTNVFCQQSAASYKVSQY